MTRTFRIALVLLLALPTAAAAQSREQQQTFADLRMLQEQVQQLRLAVNTLSDALKQSNADLTRKLDAANNTILKGFADQKQATDGVADTQRTLRGKMDDTDVSIQRLSSELDTVKQAVVSISTALNQVVQPPGAASPDPTAAAGDMAGGAAGATAPTAGAAPTGAPSPDLSAPSLAGTNPLISGLSAKRMYDTAWGDFMAGHYDMSISGFTSYLQSFPDALNAPDAECFLGDAYRQLGKDKDAIDAYTVVVTKFKGSAHEPEAYYDRGMAYEHLGNKAKARADFQKVVTDFSDSTYAALAKQSLDRIK